MINELAKGAISEGMVSTTIIPRMLLHMQGENLVPGCSFVLLRQKNLYYTDGLYRIKYKPSNAFNSRYRKFVISSDLYFDRGKFIRFANWEDLAERAKIDPRADFMMKYTTLCPELFELAKVNKGIAIPFCVDAIRYNNMLKEKIKKESGVEPDYALLTDPLLALAEEERIKARMELINNKNLKEVKKL